MKNSQQFRLHGCGGNADEEFQVRQRQVSRRGIRKIYGNDLFGIGIRSRYRRSRAFVGKVVGKRGYNQSLLLAREFCLLTGLPLEEDNLIKIKETVQQEKLTNIQRRNNLSDAFDVVDKTAFVGKKCW